jgi:hypothetical protein
MDGYSLTEEGAVVFLKETVEYIMQAVSGRLKF